MRGGGQGNGGGERANHGVVEDFVSDEEVFEVAGVGGADVVVVVVFAHAGLAFGADGDGEEALRGGHCVGLSRWWMGGGCCCGPNGRFEGQVVSRG